MTLYSTKNMAIQSQTLNAYLHNTDHVTERLLRGEKKPKEKYIARSAGNIAKFELVFQGASHR